MSEMSNAGLKCMDLAELILMIGAKSDNFWLIAFHILETLKCNLNGTIEYKE